MRPPVPLTALAAIGLAKPAQPNLARGLPLAAAPSARIPIPSPTIDLLHNAYFTVDNTQRITITTAADDPNTAHTPADFAAALNETWMNMIYRRSPKAWLTILHSTTNPDLLGLKHPAPIDLSPHPDSPHPSYTPRDLLQLGETGIPMHGQGIEPFALTDAYIQMWRQFDNLSRYDKELAPIEYMKRAGVRTFRAAAALRRFRVQYDEGFPPLRRFDDFALLESAKAYLELLRVALDSVSAEMDGAGTRSGMESAMINEAAKLLNTHLMGPLSEAFAAKGFMTDEQVVVVEARFRLIYGLAVPKMFEAVSAKMTPLGLMVEEQQNALAVFGAANQWLAVCQGTRDRGCVEREA